jgi:DNA-binding GntR family transcriptional regulator
MQDSDAAGPSGARRGDVRRKAAPPTSDHALDAWRPEPVAGRVTVQDGVYRRLREALMAGRLDPGQVLTIAAVAKMFGTSQMPVREAIRQLVAEKALLIVAKGSAVVPDVNRAKLDEICRARVVLERTVVEAATMLVDDDDIAALEVLAERHRQSGAREGAYAMLERNREFHFELYRYGRSATLNQLIETLWLGMGPYMRLLARHIDSMMGAGDPIYAGTHADIIRGLRNRDALFAGDATAADIRATQGLLRNLI